MSRQSWETVGSGCWWKQQAVRERKQLAETLLELEKLIHWPRRNRSRPNWRHNGSK
ncbi:MAG: hypothetical protein ACOY3U_02995 [Bacillota bacterium]|uniref:hypothetical protein n=1 Tax=Desulforamulus profundi TaxID=1383067 RepID=UPI0015D4B44F|nr:hypothetical protein [Desulforamulus profundi]